MTTDLMEVYSLEEGDQILVNDEVYLVQVIEAASPTASRLWLVDEEGFQHSIEVEDTKKLRLVLDNLASID